MTDRTTREQFVGSIADALGSKTTSAPTPPVVSDDLARLTGADEPLVELFEQRATAVGMHVYPCTGGESSAKLVEVLKQIDVKSVVCGIGRLSHGASLEQAMADAGIELSDWRGDRAMTPSYTADAGVTDVAAALAETGSLVYASDADHGRSLMLVPPVHVAVVLASSILPDMLDYVRSLGGKSPRDLPASQTIITGPSKTADIEGVLVTGVHGPGAVHVILITDA